MLVIEDVDAAFKERDSKDVVKGITFSGLLNAIDGLAAQEGHLLFMTTNHIERLDPALIRPGRIDRRFEIGLSGALEIQKMFEVFFPDCAELAKRLAAKVGDRRVCPAAVQGHFLLHKDSPVSAIDEIGDILSSDPRSGEISRSAA